MYDEYNLGPTLEMLRPPDVYSIITFPFEHMIQSTLWTMWKDHGYRLLTNAFQMFYLSDPICIMDHVMTIGKVGGHGHKGQVSDRVTGNYSLHRGTHGNTNTNVVIDDVVIMSASEMVDYGSELCGLHNPSQHGHNAFICGHLPISMGVKEMYVCLDLEGDSIDISADDIDISINIDSII
jgi:hypothetical protein